MDFIKTKTFRTLIGVKLAVISIAFLMYSKNIYVGEVLSPAAEGEKDKSEVAAPDQITEKNAQKIENSPTNEKVEAEKQKEEKQTEQSDTKEKGKVIEGEPKSDNPTANVTEGEKKADTNDKKGTLDSILDRAAKFLARSEPPSSDDKIKKEDAKTVSKEVDKNKRRSFLDDLLDLPKIDTSTAKKDELGRYLALIEQKQRQIEDRTQLIREKEANLMKLEKSVEHKLTALQDERQFYTQTIQKEKEIQQDRLNKIVLLYAKMEPKKAGPIFEAMDRDLVVAIFKALPEKTVTKFLEAMSPAKSVALSEYYGRIKSGKEFELLKEVNSSLVKEFQECKGLPQGLSH